MMCKNGRYVVLVGFSNDGYYYSFLDIIFTAYNKNYEQEDNLIVYIISNIEVYLFLDI